MKKIFYFTPLLISLNAFSMNLDNSSYHIISKQTGNCLYARQDTNANHTKIVQQPCYNSQKFLFTKNNKQYTIASSNGNKLVIPLNSSSNGINLLQSSTLETLFTLEKQDSGYYKIQTSTDKYVSTEPTSLDIIQFHKNDSDHQLWQIGDINPSKGVPYYQSQYSIKEFNQNTTNNGNLTAALKNIKETWSNKYLIFHGVQPHVLPYAILDAGIGKKFQIGNLRTLSIKPSNNDNTNSFKISTSNDGTNYTLLYESKNNNPTSNMEHIMQGEARFIKLEMTGTGLYGYSRLFFDHTSFPFWDLSIK